MTDADAVRRVALALPRTYEVQVRGRWKFRVKQIVYCAFSRDELDIGFGFPKAERDGLIASDPETFFLPPTSDLRYQWVCAHLDRLDDEEMRELVTDAWRMCVPKMLHELPELPAPAARGLEPRRAAGVGRAAPAAAPLRPVRRRQGGASAAAASCSRTCATYRRRARPPTSRCATGSSTAGSAVGRELGKFSWTSYYFRMSTLPGETARSRWQERYAKARLRDADFTTLSGMEVEPAYGTDDSEWPGEFPFTRGLHATGNRGRTWTIRQFAGFGSAKHTNERFKMILGRGGGGLSVAFDMPTLMGRDSDDPRSLGEVGHCGVAIDSAADMEILFDGIDLGEVTTSMTISGPAVPIFCMMIVAAERAGVDTGKLNGTLQTDIFKEYIAQKEWIFEPEPHLRLIGDLMEYCAERIPAYKPLSVSGYHIREAGSTAAQELAFTLADGFGYVELGLSRGLDVDVLRARAVLLLRRPPRLLRGDREVPRRPPDLGALDARRLRRQDRQGAVAAVPHPDRRACR